MGHFAKITQSGHTERQLCPSYEFSSRRHTEAKRRSTIKRVNQRHQDTINEDEEDHPGARHHPIVRTNTYKDPDGLEERDI